MNTMTAIPLALAWLSLPCSLDSQSVVPVTLTANNALEQVRAGYQAGRVSTSAVNKRVRIEWTAMALMNGSSPTEDAWGNTSLRWSTDTQDFTTRYWPTACCVLDNSSLVVCGKTQAGDTIIELWPLEWPDPMPLPVTSIQTGVTKVGIALPMLGTKTTLYTGNAVGKQLVRNACGIRRSTGSAANLLIQFDDSNDIYTLDLTTHALALLASATNSGGALGIVPSLATGEQDYVEFGDKIGGAETGYTYTFGYTRWGSPMCVYDPNYQTLILLDANRDGIIEATRYYTNDQRVAGGWTDSTNFANYWKP